jgi:hypothetical protein
MQTMDVTLEPCALGMLVRPESDAGRAWMEANLSGESTWHAGRLVVERAYAADLVAGMEADGLRVETPMMRRVARLMERAAARGRLPTDYPWDAKYPKVGQHDRCIAERHDGEWGGYERVYVNRTGRRFVYILLRGGFISAAGVTSSVRKGERWAAAVRHKARLLAILAREDRP